MKEVATRTRVFCTLQFAALHSWPAAKGAVSFLANEHRHVFHIRCEWDVEHDDRDLEFVTCKIRIDRWLRNEFPHATIGHMSCEMLARKLLVEFDCCKVEVSEDGENGATVEVL